MVIIPLQAIASQLLSVLLDGQSCQISVYQKNTGLFLNLSMNNLLVIGGVLCENKNRTVRDAYFGFRGDLCFLDNQGDTDPVYTGLGGRYNLMYLTAVDVPLALSVT